ncbi:hypothetical protein BVRB_023660, partial [Beta vulgaris subsp. vulgaris]
GLIQITEQVHDDDIGGGHDLVRAGIAHRHSGVVHDQAPGDIGGIVVARAGDFLAAVPGRISGPDCVQDVPAHVSGAVLDIDQGRGHGRHRINRRCRHGSWNWSGGGGRVRPGAIGRNVTSQAAVLNEVSMAHMMGWWGLMAHMMGWWGLMADYAGSDHDV